MNKVTVSGFIKVPLESLDELRIAIAEHAKLSRAEPGCLTFRLTENETTPGRFDLYEEFVNEAAFDAHKQRAAASTWGTVSQNIERHFNVSLSQAPGQARD